MMLDVALGLNAVIWFAALVFPAFGFAKGYYDQRPVLVRAQLILLCLLVLLLAVGQGLKYTATPEQSEDVSELLSYRLWAIGGLAVSSALGWATYFLGRKLALRKS
ncbi:hypothetical protein [Shimia sp.]|uniref:hypothetical protein n=1 Tax=Shimia sp. TaxID=1954381 RepID=UPI003299B7CC